MTDPATLKPRDKDIDAYGITHPGKVREVNEDHFLIAALSKQILVEHTSLPAEAQLQVEPERLASLAMVADGVGKGGGGEVASRLALQAVSEYVARSTEAFFASYSADTDDPEVLSRVLTVAALECHASLLERAEQDPEHRRFGTTLTMWFGLWPHAYLLQVGDSRCYIYRDGELTQISRDQTMAQELVDQGVMSRTDAAGTRWAHVLSSAIGGHEAAPVITRVTRDWGTIVMLCSDGLTKHVSDERIAERLGNLKSAKQTCEELLQDALDDGGSDNITLIIGRTIKPTDI
ncbi:MAG: protein phosphatase 2C domain-containing protein [Gemmatimonadales bacterium]